MNTPNKIWIAGPASEYRHYYPNATEAEGEHGGQAVEYTLSDLIAARAAPAIEPQGLGQNDTIDSFCLTLRRLVSDAYAERDRFSHIAATIRINALHNGATNAEVDAMLSGDVSFLNWIAAKVEALAARPALHPATTREAQLEAALRDTLEFLERHSNRYDDVNGKHPQTIVEEARAALFTPATEPQGYVEGLEAALNVMLQSVCGPVGFAEAVRHNSGHAYPWPSLDAAEAQAIAALAPFARKGE